MKREQPKVAFIVYCLCSWSWNRIHGMQYIQQCNVSLQDSLVCFGRYGVRVPLTTVQGLCPNDPRGYVAFCPWQCFLGQTGLVGGQTKSDLEDPHEKKKSWDQFILPNIGLPGHHSVARPGDVAWGRVPGGWALAHGVLGMFYWKDAPGHAGEIRSWLGCCLW